MIDGNTRARRFKATLIGPMLSIARLCGFALLTFALSASVDRQGTAWAKGKGMVAPVAGRVRRAWGRSMAASPASPKPRRWGRWRCLFLIWVRGEFSVNLLREASMRTFKSTGTIIWVTFGATALAGAYTIAGGPTYVANLIVGYDLPTMGVLAGDDGDLPVPRCLHGLDRHCAAGDAGVPAHRAETADQRTWPDRRTGFQPMVRVWFGILFCVNMQVSFLSPPFGPAAFYLKSVAPPHITLPDIFRGFLPFIAMQLFILMIILLAPEITTVFL